MSDLPTVLKFDSTGKLVKSFGAGLLVFPHGIHVDRDGNVWVTDGQDNAPRAARGAGPARGAAPAGGGAPAANPAAAQAGAGRARGPAPAPTPGAGATKGHQIFKFSP